MLSIRPRAVRLLSIRTPAVRSLSIRPRAIRRSGRRIIVSYPTRDERRGSRVDRQRGWKFPSSTPLPGALDTAGSNLKRCAALLAPNFEDALEARDLLRFLEHAFPALANPWALPTTWKSFEEIDKITLEGRMRLDKHREAGSTRRFDIEAVPADYSSAYSLEHLSRFGGGRVD